MIKTFIIGLMLNATPVWAATAPNKETSPTPDKPAAGQPIPNQPEKEASASAKDPKSADDAKKAKPIKFDPLDVSTVDEIKVLSELAKRSEEISAREKELKFQTLTLKAAETSMNEKLKQFDILKQDLLKMLDKLKERDEKQFNDLVKIYTSMKPKQAATILNQMEMGILKEIIKRMQQKKAALILAAMDTKKAKDVTQNLAKEGHKLS